MPELDYIRARYEHWLKSMNLNERGEISEKVLVTAAFAALAIAACAVITVKVMNKANEIPIK